MQDFRNLVFCLDADMWSKSAPCKEKIDIDVLSSELSKYALVHISGSIKRLLSLMSQEDFK